MASEQDDLRHRRHKNRNSPDPNATNYSKNGSDSELTPVGQRWDGSYGNPGGGSTGNTQPFGAGGRQSPSAPVFTTTSNQPRPVVRTAHEHAMAVQQWMWQCQLWHSMNWTYMMSFPMYAANAMSLQLMQQQASGVGGAPNTGAAGAAAPPPLPGFALAGAPGGVVQNNGFGIPGPAQADVGNRNAGTIGDGANTDIGVRFRIPSLWKRVTAEFIDFFVLFLIKLVVTILTVEYVGIVDIQKYDLDLLLSQNIDYNTAFAMTSELIAMEIINRIFICIFETLCLRRGVAGTIGGTTPGKSIMGLRVVSCEQVYDGPGFRMIRVLPAGDIGIWNALVRSVIKNFSLAFFFPVCFTVFFFQHNRAAYDIISNCIVVELIV